MRLQRSANGRNGRDGHGRFAKGNPGGPGNPYAKRVAAVRSMILNAVSKADLREIVAALVRQAKSGDVVAARELFNRLVGKAGVVGDVDLDAGTEAPTANAVAIFRECQEAKEREAALQTSSP